MRKILLVFLSCLFIVLITASCDKSENPAPVAKDYLVFGHYYGMCYGDNCVEIFKIEKSSLSEDTLDKYPFFCCPYSGVFIPRDHQKYEMVKHLNGLIPAQLLLDTNKVIGTPDAFDQGGLYLEVKIGNTTRFWYIDMAKSNLPPYLHPLVDSLNSCIQKLM
jgi:hypothetical protein